MEETEEQQEQQPEEEKPKEELKEDKDKESKDDGNDNSSSSNIDDLDDLDMDTDDTEEEDDDVVNNGMDRDDDVGVSNVARAEEILIDATTLKEEGNAHFKKADFTKAQRSYRKGIQKAMKLNKNNTGDEQVKGLLVSLYNNLSMVCFKLNKYKMSRDVASKALHILDDSKSTTPSTSSTTTTTMTANLVKSLYRRAVAHRKLGDIDFAKQDLKRGLQYDPTNTAIKKEYVNMQKQQSQQKAAQKKNLQKAFSSSGKTSLYDDKEQERKKKQILEKQKQIQKENERQQLKKQWEDECVQLMASGKIQNKQDLQSFEDWEKQRQKKLKKEAKEKKKKEEEEEQRRRKAEEEARRRQRQDNRTENDSSHNDDDEQFTEQELAMFRGYKKTSDGRTTSYFTREQSEHEKSLIGDITPQRISSTTTTATTTSATSETTPMDTTSSASQLSSTSTIPQQQLQNQHHHYQQQSNVSSSATNKRPSAWNTAGTWEEKDTTAWCTSHLKTILNQTKTIPTSITTTTTTTATNGNDDNVVFARVTSVEDVTGDASVAMGGKKKKYIFDFHCKLKFQLLIRQPQQQALLPEEKTAEQQQKDQEDQEEKQEEETNNSSNDEKEEDKDGILVIATGTLQLPDICSTHHEELEVLFQGWKNKTKSKTKVNKLFSSSFTSQEDVMEHHKNELIQQIRKSINQWVEDFNHRY